MRRLVKLPIWVSGKGRDSLARMYPESVDSDKYICHRRQAACIILCGYTKIRLHCTTLGSGVDTQGLEHVELMVQTRANYPFFHRRTSHHVWSLPNHRYLPGTVSGPNGMSEKRPLSSILSVKKDGDIFGGQQDRSDHLFQSLSRVRGQFPARRMGINDRTTEICIPSRLVPINRGGKRYKKARC